MAKAKRRGGKYRTIYQTKSGSATTVGRRGRGKPAKKISNRQHRQLGTLQSKRRAAAYRPRRRTR